MRILVTGAAGFIGSHLAERLAMDGHHVVGVDAFTDYYDPALKELNARAVESTGVRMQRLDLAADDLASAVEGAEAVFHLAAQPGNSPTTGFEAYLRNNVLATQRLVAACRAAAPDLALFVNVSTSSVYGLNATDDEDAPPKPVSEYGATKLAAEQLVLAAQRTAGFPACSLRIFSVIGPRERPDKLYHKLIRCILEGEAFPLFEGSERHSRTFTHVGDAVDAFVAALARRDRVVGEIVNIGSDVELTTADGMRIVEELLGKQARIERRPARAGDQLHTHANIAKAARLIDWRPTTPPQESLRAMVAWYRDEVFGKV